MTTPFDRFLQLQGFALLDGGLATELEHRGHDLKHKLWSAKLLRHDSDVIRQVHLDFLRAGADCITAATYQANLAGFAEAGISSAEGVCLSLKAIELAIEARSQFLAENQDDSRIPPLVAASIGPYGAYLADGSEYRGDYSISPQQLLQFHQPRWELLQSSGADVFAFETIPSFEEARACINLLQASPAAQAWISFSCKDGQHICDGTPLRKCAELVRDCAQIFAVGVNCTAPQFIPDLLQECKIGAPEKVVVVYPNSGETYDGNLKTWSGAKDVIDFPQSGKEWFDLGARLLGGCCRITPAQIFDLRISLLKGAMPDPPNFGDR
jgi:homocysteine S-methyltransferase